MEEYRAMPEPKPSQDAEAVFKRNILAVLLLPTASAQPVEHILLRALLRHHTCGALVKTLSRLQEGIGNKYCADVLSAVIDTRDGMDYVHGEPSTTKLRVLTPSIRNDAMAGIDVVVL